MTNMWDKCSEEWYEAQKEKYAREKEFCLVKAKSIFELMEQGKTSEAQEKLFGDLPFEQQYENWIEALRNRVPEIAHDIDVEQADIRFSTALSARRVRRSSVAIIGLGGLGNWQWRVLLSMGFRRLFVIDDDVVSIENVGSQVHSIFDIGLSKAEAVRRAALQYRGVSIAAYSKKVFKISDVIETIGETPNFIIGCTDSAEFRNSFIKSLMAEVYQNSSTQLPELFLDYRMALGDWTAYIFPVKLMRELRFESYAHSIFQETTKIMEQYTNDAIFPPEKAVQEACTERAIAYTGANVASFTGAVLHWWINEGSAKLAETAPNINIVRFYSDTDVTLKFHWKTSYSSRDFDPITDTLRARKLSARLYAARLESYSLRTGMEKLLNQLLCKKFGARDGSFELHGEPEYTTVTVSNLKPGEIAVVITDLNEPLYVGLANGSALRLNMLGTRIVAEAAAPDTVVYNAFVLKPLDTGRYSFVTSINNILGRPCKLDGFDTKECFIVNKSDEKCFCPQDGKWLNTPCGYSVDVVSLENFRVQTFPFEMFLEKYMPSDFLVRELVPAALNPQLTEFMASREQAPDKPFELVDSHSLVVGDIILDETDTDRELYEVVGVTARRLKLRNAGQDTGTDVFSARHFTNKVIIRRRA